MFSHEKYTKVGFRIRRFQTLRRIEFSCRIPLSFGRYLEHIFALLTIPLSLGRYENATFIYFINYR